MLAITTLFFKVFFMQIGGVVDVKLERSTCTNEVKMECDIKNLSE